ncbi:MAG: helix-turn-helix domain-containing protein [Prevotella sp.]|nr:helix-turn-helix domain-containing protein [Prevotella sp.]
MKYVFDRQFGKVLESAGIDVCELLRGAHLPEDLLSRREILLAKEEYFSLMESAGRQATGETAIRVATGNGIEFASPPVFAAYCSSDGCNFIKRLSHYKQLIGPLRFIVTEQDGKVQIEIKGIDDHDQIPAFWVEVEMAFILNLIRKATKAHIVPLAIAMQHDVESHELRCYLGCNPEPTDKNMLTFSTADMQRPFTSRNDSMWKYIEPELRRRLSEMDVDDSMAARVRSALVELLPAGKCTVGHVASKLCLSRRTLQRKLADEGTTFQRQLNSTRLLLARHYLKNSERTSDDVAFLLGYEDTTSFLRAFNLWTGMTITEYKRNQQ